MKSFFSLASIIAFNYVIGLFWGETAVLTAIAVTVIVILIVGTIRSLNGNEESIIRDITITGLPLLSIAYFIIGTLFIIYIRNKFEKNMKKINISNSTEITNVIMMPSFLIAEYMLIKKIRQIWK